MEEEYLGLSLSLSSSGNGCHTHLSLLPSSSCHLLFPYSGIDVNEAPSTAAAGRSSEEDGGASSSAGGKRTDQHDASSRGVSDEDDDGDGCRKKLRLTKDQSAVLEESFKEHSTLSPLQKQKLALAKQLKLRPRQVEVWFQNRRARTKLKQTEVDCELLRRCCQDLTEENRRLQKEVQELRALKLSPQFYMHLTPPTTLTLCPSCERVATSASLTSSSKNQPPPEHHHQRPIAAPFPLRLPFLDAPPPRT